MQRCPLGSEKDVAAEAHGPDVVGVHTLQAKESTRGAVGLGGPCCPVPLEDSVGGGKGRPDERGEAVVAGATLRSPIVCRETRSR